MKLRSDNRKAARFYDEVRKLLADVPWNQRQELLASLAERIQSLPRESEPETVLGPPVEYAHLIRDAAGYGPEATRHFAYIRAWRLRTKVLVVMIPLLVALSIAGAVSVARYQPLSADPNLAGTSGEVVDAGQFANGTFYRYEPGVEAYVGYTLRNNGRTDVTVTGADIAPQSPLNFKELRATTWSAACCIPKDAPIVDQVVVHPGDDDVVLFVMMEMESDYKLCAGCAVATNYPTLDVEVLGIHHRVSFSDAQLTVIGPAAEK